MDILFNTHIFRRNEVDLEAGEKYSFNEDGSEMTIMDVNKLDEGEYTCIAKNKAGESEQELSLRVFGKAECFMGIHELKWQYKMFQVCGNEVYEYVGGRRTIVWFSVCFLWHSNIKCCFGVGCDCSLWGCSLRI